MVDGVEYPSQSAAACALGITPQAVAQRLGYRPSGRPPPGGKRGHVEVPVELDRVVATRAEHAARLGVGRNQVYRRILVREARTAELWQSAARDVLDAETYERLRAEVTRRSRNDP